ncbi:MAG TPA: LUD domain-containing protein [Elusimicrobiales bacterium]|nr:LUD domain-containing protein [Elusimicrobiales bacterium]
MDANMRAMNGIKLEKAAAALAANGFGARVFDTGEEAAAYAAALPGVSAGMGGSMTARDLGLAAKLRAAGKEIVTHSPGMTPEERRAVWLRAQASDLYFASPQAVTMDGKLIFLDAYGNRGAAVIYGPKKIVLIAGANKLSADEAAGLRRARDIAAVANNIRLKKDNPCVKTGRCADCASPSRICNAVTLLWKRPLASDIEVLLVNEDLGY